MPKFHSRFSENHILAFPGGAKTLPKSIENRSQEPSMLRCMLTTLENRLRHPSRTLLRRLFNIKSKFWPPTWTQVGSPVAHKIHKNRSWSQLGPQDPCPEPPRPPETRFLTILELFSIDFSILFTCLGINLAVIVGAFLVWIFGFLIHSFSVLKGTVADSRAHAHWICTWHIIYGNYSFVVVHKLPCPKVTS